MMSRIPILTYHSIDSSGSVVSISPQAIAGHFRLLQEYGFAVISLDEALRALRDHLPVEKKAVLTFDDGFSNFYTEAFPLLAERKMPATVFLVTNYCGQDNQWPGQSKKAPPLPLLSWSQIAELGSAGIEFGSHSCTHPHLTRLSRNCALREIVQSRDAIQEKTGRPVNFFAYPYGSSNEVIRAMVQEHFQGAVGTNLSETTSADDPHNLSRIDMYYLSRRFHLLASSRLASYLTLRNLARRARQSVSP